MQFLITGGAGFIGSFLASHLAEVCDVTVVDDLSAGTRFSSGEFLKNLCVTVNEANRAVLAEAVRSADMVIHLAATVGVANVISDAAGTISNNTESTKVILDLCKTYMKPLVFTSTSEVYGKRNDVLKEDGDVTFGPTTQPRWSYAASKYLDELLVMDTGKKCGLPVLILRMFNVAGASQSGRMVIPRFVSQAASKKPITVFGDGSQLRSFTHIDDALAAILNLIFVLESTPELVSGQVINVTSAETVTVKQIADYIATKFGDATVEYDCERRVYGNVFTDIPKRLPSNSKLCQITKVFSDIFERREKDEMTEQLQGFFSVQDFGARKWKTYTDIIDDVINAWA